MYPPLMLRTDPVQLKAKDANQRAEKAGLKAGKWKALEWNLPFFKQETFLCELTGDDIMAADRHYIFRSGDHAVPMRYTSGHVEEMAKAQGLILTRDTIDDYIRFYMAFTRGQAGRVLPIEQVDQLPLREELTLIIRRKLQTAITPIIIYDAQSITGCFLIGDKLFHAKATADASGTVSLEPHNLLADTLPVQDLLLEE